MTEAQQLQGMLDRRRQSLAEAQSAHALSSAERQRLQAELDTLAKRLTEIEDEIVQHEQGIDALKRALATYQEHQPQERATREPRERVLTEIDEVVQARHEAERQADPPKSKPARRERALPPGQRAALQNPGKVMPRNIQPGKKIEGKATPVRWYEKDIDLSQVSPTDLHRARLLYQILVDEGGEATQADLGLLMAAALNANDQTGQTVVSRVLPILHAQRKVEHPNEVREGSDGRKTLGMVRVTTAPNQASAGLGTDDGNFAGTTTRPADARARGARIQVESGAFETKR